MMQVNHNLFGDGVGLPMAYACDWLSFFVDKSKMVSGTYYKIVPIDGANMLFSKLSNIVDISGRSVAILQHEPTSPVLPPDCGIIKVDNEILYHENRAEIIQKMLEDTSIAALSINRVDISADFNALRGYPNPELLIRDLLAGTVQRVGRSRWFCHGDDVNTLSLIRKSGNGSWVGVNDWSAAGYAHHFDYLRYGKRNSAVSCYLYNKTKELNDKKAYIRLWQRLNGLNLDMDVWRLEFSLKGARISAINKEIGVAEKLDWRELLARIPQYWHQLAGKYWDIRRKDNKRIDRCSRLELWDTLDDAETKSYLLRRWSRGINPTYADKVALRKLYTYSNELYLAGNDFKRWTHVVGARITHDKDLEDWAHKHNILWLDPDEIPVN